MTRPLMVMVAHALPSSGPGRCDALWRYWSSFQPILDRARSSGSWRYTSRHRPDHWRVLNSHGRVSRRPRVSPLPWPPWAPRGMTYTMTVMAQLVTECM